MSSIKFFAFLFVFSLISCSIVAPLSYEYDYRNSDNNLYHRYEARSSVNPESDFAVQNRKIEFDYDRIAEDSIMEIGVMLTTGYNEGELLPQIELILKNDEILGLTLDNVITRDYVEHYSYNTSTPVTRFQTVNDPGGVDVVVQPDGTHKHVHRAPSTKTISVNDTETAIHSGSKSQIFNQSKLRLEKRYLELIRNSQIVGFKLYLQNGSLDIRLTELQQNELFKYF